MQKKGSRLLANLMLQHRMTVSICRIIQLTSLFLTDLGLPTRLSAAFSHTPLCASGSGSPAPEIRSTVVIEEETEREAKQSDKQAAPQPSGSNAPSQIPAGFTRPMPNVSQEDMQQTLRMMRENPSMMEHMRNTLASMTPEQMQAAVRQSPSPPAVSLIQCLKAFKYDQSKESP